MAEQDRAEAWEEVHEQLKAARDNSEAHLSAWVAAGKENSYILHSLLTVHGHLQHAKPDERSERARRFAVTITELEKVIAYFKMWVVDDG